MPWNKRVEVPEPYWIAHIHWVYEAEAEGRGEWVRVDPFAELPADLAAEVVAEMEEIGHNLGWERVPRLWKRVR